MIDQVLANELAIDLADTQAALARADVALDRLIVASRDNDAAGDFLKSIRTASNSIRGALQRLANRSI